MRYKRRDYSIQVSLKGKDISKANTKVSTHIAILVWSLHCFGKPCMCVRIEWQLFLELHSILGIKCHIIEYQTLTSDYTHYSSTYMYMYVRTAYIICMHVLCLDINGCIIALCM